MRGGAEVCCIAVGRCRSALSHEALFARAFLEVNAKLTLFGTWRGLLVRDFHLGKAAGGGGIHSGHNFFNVAAQSGPLLITDNDERDSSAF